MTYLTILSALTLGFALSANATARDTVRLVFHTSSVQMQAEGLSGSSMASGCVSTPAADAQWCVGLSDDASGASAASFTDKHTATNAPSFQVQVLPAQGYQADAIASLFNQDGRFGLVEVDAQTSVAPVEPPMVISDEADGNTEDSTEDGTDVNDPNYARYQKWYYFADHKTSASGADISGLWALIGLDKIKTQSAPLDVLVLDSEFETNTDVTYYDGRSFSTTALLTGGPLQRPNDDYSVRPEVDEVCDSHGLQVASVIGGTIDNNYGQAGVTNNVRLHALRVMTCGVGFMSDVANALRWLVGKPFTDSNLVTPYSGKPGIINMSLSAGYSECPNFMQDAINDVLAAGYTVVVAAGNQSGDSQLRTPGNCDGVITVGAIDRSGYLPPFSNRGANVDVMAQGVYMPVPTEDSHSTALASGTSFASPLVAGILAAVKRDTGAEDAVLKLAVRITANPTQDPQCNTSDVCGAGMVNAKEIHQFATDAISGKLHTIEHALGNKTPCEQAWLLDYFGVKARLCSLYNVVFMRGYIEEGTTYQLVSIPMEANWQDTTPTVEGQFTQAEVKLSSLTPDTRQYGVQLCEAGVCGEVQLVNAEQATEATKPAVCE